MVSGSRQEDSTADDVKEILSRAGIFQGADQEAVQTLLGKLEMVRFPCGITIFNKGGSGGRLYTIIDGKMKLTRRSADGRENLLTITGSSDVFGKLSIFSPDPRTSSTVCVIEVSAASMSADQLQEWVGSHLNIPAQLLRMLARRLHHANNSLADLIFTDVPGRVARSLLRLANHFGVQEGSTLRVSHDLTQEEITQLVGASRETVNKALVEFAHRDQVCLEGESVLISDTERLARRTR